MVASEVSPWAKTGGLADVAGALPAALDAFGHDVTVVMPRYRGMPAGDEPAETRTIRLGSILQDVSFQTLELSKHRRVVMVDAPTLFERDGIYGTGGRDYPDNYRRFGVLSAAALEIALTEAGSRPFDVLHAHDWQAGLLPTLVRAHPDRYRALQSAALVFTIHNIAYQGTFPREVVPELGLPWAVFGMNTGEFWGQFSFLKAGLAYSDYITTVSPTYARETLTPQFGNGMEGILASRAAQYVGILNGIDTDTWNPATDPHLPAHFDATDLTGKRQCKRALLSHFGLAVGDDALDRPLVGMVSRLAEQKGLDLIRDAASDLAELEAAWVFIGTGDPVYEALLKELSARYPSRFGVYIGFSEPLAHLLEAGADIFLMPSRFEPCGLNQMYSLRYGTVPIVTAVGGLDDTIQPYSARARYANGFKLREYSPEALVRTVRQATRLYHDHPVWNSLVQQGMSADHSWETSAGEYVKVYRRAREVASNRGSH
jgi:starch synthase